MEAKKIKKSWGIIYDYTATIYEMDHVVYGLVTFEFADVWYTIGTVTPWVVLKISNDRTWRPWDG